MAVPGRTPSSGRPKGLVRGADREGPIFPRTPWPSIGATYFATLGIAAALRARQISGRGQRVTTSLLQGALAASCLNWQRVENPDAPLYWMWPVDSRSIEGLFECADGKWVHHWTLRPRWVLAASEGDTLSAIGLDTSYRDDPDRVSMESDGLLAGIFLYPQLEEAFKKFPSDQWVSAGEEAGLGMTTVRPPGEALADKSFLADGCVVEVDDPELGMIHHAGPLLEFSATPGAVAGPAPRPGQHTDEVLAEARSGLPEPRLTHSDPKEPLAHPLAGVRVLDLGLGVAGPFTGRALADLGADVIKINALYDKYWNGTHMGLGVNRGKRSIALNLKNPDRQGSAGEAAAGLRRDHTELAARRGRQAGSRLRDPARAIPTTRLLQYSGLREGSEIRSARHRPECRGHDGNGVGGRRMRRRQPSALEPVQHGGHRQCPPRGHRHHDRPVPPRQDGGRPGGEHLHRQRRAPAHVLCVDPFGRHRSRTGGRWTAVSSGSPPTTASTNVRSAGGSSWPHSRVRRRRGCGRCFRASPQETIAESVADWLESYF